ncbi:restriction endonuclease subunit S [[Limnothrix rosea] IAM M-220]|uniref:restriction endonuclease subunit S n=1 Tax=[Limnothrix rosea] IAM M-220 TaxID=454133 RepID=UPI000968BCBB|nr:restriction endonuclease subunit S [[Limnothrix rosea] IAM M-220]OKH12327.1 hypothetical protein NIES208_16270 [[Limnothrix rosea] IAM M-220]
MKNFLLSDICDIQIGRTPSRSKLEFWGGSLPWLSIADMGKSRDIYKTKEGITELGAKTFNGRRVKEGTVLFSFKLSIGKIGIARVPLYTNEAIAALEIKEKSLVCEEYLYYALQGLNLDQKTDRAVMGKTLNKKKLAAIKVPLPSLTEQRRIAAILDKADEIRRKRSQAIQLTEDLGRSLFLDMFGDPVTNPKAWTLVTLGSQVESLKYGTNSKSHDFQQENDLPVLRIPNIIGEKISWDNLKFGAISEKDRRKNILG